MKRIQLIFLILTLVFLPWTAASCGGSPSEEAAGQVQAGQAETADPYKTDRELRTDYENIVPSGEHEVRILFVNAGRADSILIEADGKYYVIDTGEVTSVPKINASLEYLGVDKIEAVFLTHSNSDHIDGLPMLSELWEIDACYTAAIAVEMNKMQASISKASLEQTLLEPGQVIPVSDGLYFEVLGPIRYNPLDDNDNSLVLRMTVNGRTILFAGDMQYDEEKTLMSAGFDLRCDLLKVGNHGNKDATSVSFMEETSPSYAVITTDRTEDENSAHKSVCKGLEEVGAEIFITDEYDLGLLCKIAPDGKITMENAEADDASADVRFVSISKEKQTAVIKNHDKKTVDLSGWFIISERGGEIFRFPDGAVIEPGEEKTIACINAKGTSDFLWKDTSVWNKNKDDAGRLVDRYGNVVNVMESE